MSESSERAQREKWLQPIAEMRFCEIEINYLYNLSVRQLEETLEAMDSCTSTNCWFAYIDVSRHFRTYVQQLIEQRKKVKLKRGRTPTPIKLEK